MIRRIIVIDREKCNGCGQCARACHEGAIGMVDGKAALLREDYCDGLGDCLPACPADAISFEEREAAPYDAEAVRASKVRATAAAQDAAVPGELRNFPVQLKLASPAAPCFDGADLLVAADCAAYAYVNFHADFIRGRAVLIGCPKLDGVNYAGKLEQIFREHDVRSVTLARMTVPCCGGLAFAVQTALAQCGKDIPLRVVTIRPDGTIAP